MYERLFGAHTSHVEAILEDSELETLAELHVLADAAIREAVARQVDLGLDVVTDGEITSYGHYPSRDEIAAALNTTSPAAEPIPEAKSSGCCSPGPSCSAGATRPRSSRGTCGTSSAMCT